MKRLRIKFPKTELPLMIEAVGRFNEAFGYLDELSVSQFDNHQVLLVPPAESAMFVESCLDDFPSFSKQRIKQDLIKAIEILLDQEPDNLPAKHSLKVLKDLSFA